MCSMLNGRLSYLNRIKHILDKKSRLLIINAFIFSNIEYCSLIWGKCSAKFLTQIQKSINYAAKVVCNRKYTKRDNASPLLKELGWLDINKLFN